MKTTQKMVKKEQALPLYNKLSLYLKEHFGGGIWKVSLDAGLGCPGDTKGERCVYCKPASILPAAFKETGSITEQMTAGMERLRKRHKARRFIAYFQSDTNTLGSINELRMIYKEAIDFPDVAVLAVSTRPDCLSDEVLDLLLEMKKELHIWLELGLQSSNDETLRRIKRGHSASDFADAVKRAKQRGIDVCAHLIFGLPGEGHLEMKESVRFISELGLWGVKFHQLQIFKGSEMEQAYKRGELTLLALDEYVEVVVDSIEELSPEVIIHRLSAEAPLRMLSPMVWDEGKFAIKDRIERLLKERQTYQGIRFER
ncbi:MAG: TIGR01212 family radical SAM protein [Deltaproteobacteria bacterium]|nr:TIGR01212 family radical SAM protein [Deltaproteobacteria bacterium]